MRCFYARLMAIASVSLQNDSATAFLVGDMSAKSPKACSFASYTVKSAESTKKCTLQISTSRNNDDGNFKKIHSMELCPGRKSTLLRKYGKAIALSTTLIYGPMASIPSTRRALGSSAHAASSTTATASTSGSAYNFQDFKDMKGKLSLAPGANVHEYEDILTKVELEGEKALDDLKHGDKETALTIGISGQEGGEGMVSSSSVNVNESKATGRRTKKAHKKAAKKKMQTKSQVSEWESNEFGFIDHDQEDFDCDVLSLGGGIESSRGKFSLPKSREGSGTGGRGAEGRGDVVVTNEMAYNNYKASVSKGDQIKLIRKGAFYSIFPVFIITTIRGRIRAWKERKWVKQGLAIVEEERQKYLEEKKKKKEGMNDGESDEEEDDDEEDDNSGDGKE